jgi:hypothetical protein
LEYLVGLHARTTIAKRCLQVVKEIALSLQKGGIAWLLRPNQEQVTSK